MLVLAGEGEGAALGAEKVDQGEKLIRMVLVVEVERLHRRRTLRRQWVL